VTQLGERLETTPDAGSAPSFIASVAAVYAGQLARVRAARGPLLFVATLQSLGIVILLRGVVRQDGRTTAAAIVAGSTVLVAAFVGLNLLAQRFGALRARGALDYYAALPINGAAVVLGTTASYATFAIPGALLTAVVGAAMYDLSFSYLWLAVPTTIAAGIALSAVGAAIGLLLPRPELSTVAGQLAMTAVLFLGVIPPSHMPIGVRGLRDALPSTYAVDALAAALRGHPSAGGQLWRLGVTAAYAAVALLVASRTFRRAVDSQRG
jgi:ABC-2 type transport system permease protein